MPRKAEELDLSIQTLYSNYAHVMPSQMKDLSDGLGRFDWRRNGGDSGDDIFPTSIQ